jgi:hypothetical protein
MDGFSRDETASIVIIGVTVAVFAWYRAGMTGIQRWTNATLAFLVSIAFTTVVTAILKRWNPVWYRS